MRELKPIKEKILFFSLSLMISIGLITIIVLTFLNLFDIKNFQAIIASFFFIIIVIPPLILSITYFYTDLTKKVFIDISQRQIIIKKRGKEMVITHDDIMDSFCVQVDDFWGRSRGYRFPMYKYIILVLKERKRVVITNLLCEPEMIKSNMNLNSRLIYSNVPFINLTLGSGVLTSKEYEARVKEFEINFQNYSNAMLADIISQKNLYADYARDAATKIINKRKTA